MKKKQRFTQNHSAEKAVTLARQSSQVDIQADSNDNAQVKQGAKSHVFSFGDPEPVRVKDLWGDFECYDNGKWYEPPVSLHGLANSFRANPYHETALRFKRDILARSFIEHDLLPMEVFKAFAIDFGIFGNAYLEKRTSRTGKVVELKHSLALYTRKGSADDVFYFLQNCPKHDFLYSPIQPYEFPKGSVFHLKEPDIKQEIYGMPSYLSALQSVWLNEEATVFRRKYYINGSHAGYILYATDDNLEDEDIEALQKSLEQSKGPGNFRNLFLYAPGGKPDGFKLMPIGEVAARDDFLNIKNVSRDDTLVPHRIAPQLLGLVPQNSGGFGSLKDAAQVFLTLEIVPIQNHFKALNKWLGMEVMRFIDLKDLLKLLLGDMTD